MEKIIYESKINLWEGNAMKKLVILCVNDDKISVKLVRQILAKLEEVTFLKQYTTSKSANELFEIVPSRTFFDMVEECKFLEYHDEEGVFYGTPHDRSGNGEGFSLMINNVEIALEIKKYNNKVITVYVLPKEKEEEFRNTKLKWSESRTKSKLLDFLVTYETVEEAVDKIVMIAQFMAENAIYYNTI